ncbi:MAG: site-2 protease family protein [Candidatus Heimdallarchaeota archaeon]|nr:site-2 protease family protein [Candidatus Heimdallarchaeota archaeon]
MKIEYILIGVYVVISSALYYKKKSILGFQLFPMGLSTKLLNSFLDRMGKKYRLPLNRMADFLFIVLRYTPFIVLASLFAPLLLNIAYRNGIVALLPVIDTISFFTDLDFSAPEFWILAFISILLHEFFHGFLAGSNDVPILSVGSIGIPNYLFLGYVMLDYTLDSHEPEEKTEEQILDEIQQHYMKLDKKRATEKKNTKVDPFVDFDDEKRMKLERVISSGLMANFVLLVFGLILFLAFNSYWGHLLITININLIVLNLLPLSFTDGGKILKLFIRRRNHAFNAQAMNQIMDKISVIALMIFLIG